MAVRTSFEWREPKTMLVDCPNHCDDAKRSAIKLHRVGMSMNTSIYCNHCHRVWIRVKRRIKKECKHEEVRLTTLKDGKTRYHCKLCNKWINNPKSFGGYNNGFSTDRKSTD